MTTAPSPSGGFRAVLIDAAKYWEPRRVLCNLALTAICAVWVVRTWPAFRWAVVAPHLGELVGLALIANLLYSAVYVVDLAIPESPAREAWRRRRWILLLAGILLALLIAQYWIGDEIYPDALKAVP